jgi:hypothetical protein
VPVRDAAAGRRLLEARRSAETAIMEAVGAERARIAVWLRERARRTRSVKAAKALENAAEDLLAYAPGWGAETE